MVTNKRVELENPIELFSDKKLINLYKDGNLFQNEESTQYRDTILFDLNDILEFDNDFSCYEQFLKLDQKHNYAIKKFCQNIVSKGLNNQSKFMNLMYCLDIIEQKENRAIGEGKKVLSVRNQAFLKKLKQDYELRQNDFIRIEAKFLAKSKVTLKTKFQDMFKPLELYFEKIVDESYVDVIDVCVNTRNYFAHESDSLPRIDIEKLDSYILKLEVLLYLFICKELGWPLDKVWMKIRTFEEYENLR